VSVAFGIAAYKMIEQELKDLNDWQESLQFNVVNHLNHVNRVIYDYYLFPANLQFLPAG
jgi:hypothetical protein